MISFLIIVYIVKFLINNFKNNYIKNIAINNLRQNQYFIKNSVYRLHWYIQYTSTTHIFSTRIIK